MSGNYCNKEFIHELCELQERNVLLLMTESTAVFGRIVSVDNCILRVLPPIGTVRRTSPTTTVPLTNVVLFPPNIDADPIMLSMILIDICKIAHVVEGPFTELPE